MKLLVAMDGDGHFMLSHPTDRKATLNLLQKIQNGDYFYNIITDNNLYIKSDLSSYCCQTWDEIIGHFIQRGSLEYVEVPEFTPLACKCVNSEQTLAL
jgi:hypothetical protein